MSELTMLEKILSFAMVLITSGTSLYFKQHFSAQARQNHRMDQLEAKTAELHTDISVLEAKAVKRDELEQMIRDLDSRISNKLDRQQELLMQIVADRHSNN